MADIQHHRANQGMCSNAFGGHARLDKVEQSDLAGGNSQAEEMIFKATILDAVNCYCFFGLGRNGFVAQEFQWAHDYFFVAKSSEPDSWNPDRRVLVSDVRPGASRKEQVFIELTDEQMQDGCFDLHWIMSGLDRAMSISTFRRLLKMKRRNIIEANYQQVKDYLHTLRDQAAGRGEFIKPGTYHGDLIETLVAPTDESLASLLYPVRQVAQVDHRSPFRLPRRIRGHRDWQGYKAAPLRAASAEV